MRKLTRVEVFEQIRRAHFGPEKTPIRELSRTFNVHRRTVRQALASPVPPDRKEAVRNAPALGPFMSTIDEWLASDATAGTPLNGPMPMRVVVGFAASTTP